MESEANVGIQEPLETEQLVRAKRSLSVEGLVTDPNLYGRVFRLMHEHGVLFDFEFFSLSDRTREISLSTSNKRRRGNIANEAVIPESREKGDTLQLRENAVQEVGYRWVTQFTALLDTVIFPQLIELDDDPQHAITFERLTNDMLANNAAHQSAYSRHNSSF